ncbi:MAG: asparagine synthase-related protein [Pseudomonadota bacterium]
MLAAQSLYANADPSILSDGCLAFGIAPFRFCSDKSVDFAPIQAAGGRYVLVADVTFNDRADWLRRLTLDPQAARTMSDAALLLRGWERWDSDCLGHLNADFAIALWDRARKELILARDFMGQKPLFYNQNKNRVAFSTMPSGLLALPDTPQTPDLNSIADYVAIAPPRGNGWFYEGIKRVLPGGIVRITQDHLIEENHWPPPRTHLGLSTSQDYVEAAQDVFTRAVASRMNSDGLIGCHLSAGLDSSAVMARAAEQCIDGQGLLAFTAVPPVGFMAPAPPGRILNEGPLAARSAKVFSNVEHIQVSSDSVGHSATWDQAFRLFQAPLPNPCNFIWVKAINDFAKARGICRMLTGQTGNFSISYSAGAYHANLLASAQFRKLLHEVRQSVAAGETLKGVLFRTLTPLSPTWMRRMTARLRGRPTSLVDVCFIGPASNGRDNRLLQDQLIRASVRDSWTERVTALQSLDFGIFNKGHLAGWGIDTRDPTADRELVALCLSMPDDVFWRDGRDRALARAMVQQWLPSDVVNEPRRGYQAADWRRSLRLGVPALLDEVERARNSVRSSDLLDIDGIEAALKSMGQDDRPGQEDELKLRRGLLRSLSAAHFIRLASGSNF